MAKAAAKRISAQNAATLQVLLYGFSASVLIHVLFRFIIFRATAAFRHYLYFFATEAVALALASQLRSMAAGGDDLAQEGLTAYFFDIIYVTWFVHVTTAVISHRFWWVYLVIPGYFIYFAYRKAVVPFLLGGRDPVAGIFASLTGRKSSDAGAANTAAPDTQDSLSKRQQKLQKRQERGDPRVQVRQR